MANDELRALRAEAKKRQRNASQKITRLKNNGVIIGGSQFDPRISNDRIDRLNRNQLRAHIARLNQFTSRNTRFAGLAEGVPVTHLRAYQFEKTRTKFNDFVANYRKSFEGLVYDEKNNVTVKDIQDKQAGTLKHYAKGRSANRPLFFNETELSNVASDVALTSIEADMVRRMSGEYYEEKLKVARDTVGKMLDIVGDESELGKAIAALNDFQFNVAWNEMGLADELSAGYWAVQNTTVRDAAKLSDIAIGNAGKIVAWAGTIGPL